MLFFAFPMWVKLKVVQQCFSTHTNTAGCWAILPVLYAMAVWRVIESMKPVCSAWPARARTLPQFWEWKVNDRECLSRDPCGWSSFELCEDQCFPNLISSREFLQKEKRISFCRTQVVPELFPDTGRQAAILPVDFLAWFLRKQGLCKHTGVCASVCVYVCELLGCPSPPKASELIGWFQTNFAEAIEGTVFLQES